MSQAFISQNVLSQHETKTEIESTPVSSLVEDTMNDDDTLGNGSPESNERRMVSEITAENKDPTKEERFTEEDTFEREERPIKDEPLGGDAARALSSEEESHDVSTGSVEVQSTTTSENDKRKRHKREKKKQKQRLEKESKKSASEMHQSLEDPETRTTPLPRRIFVYGAWYVLDERSHD